MAEPVMDLSKIPIAPPPPGVIPNFTDPESRALRSKVVSLIGFGLMAIFVMLRLYSRGWITHSMGWDDCMSCTLDIGQVTDWSDKGACIMAMVWDLLAYLNAMITDIFCSGTRGCQYGNYLCSWVQISVFLIHTQDAIVTTNGWGPHSWDVPASTITTSFLKVSTCTCHFLKAAELTIQSFRKFSRTSVYTQSLSMLSRCHFFCSTFVSSPLIESRGFGYTLVSQ